jgi:hypothetical protein
MRVLKRGEDYPVAELKGEPALRALFMGDSYQRTCEGGFVRRQAAEAGIVVETDVTATFIPWSALDALRAEVQRRPPGSAPAGIRLRAEVAPKRKVRR